jgi:hypothetical protein
VGRPHEEAPRKRVWLTDAVRESLDEGEANDVADYLREYFHIVSLHNAEPFPREPSRFRAAFRELFR